MTSYHVEYQGIRLEVKGFYREPDSSVNFKAEIEIMEVIHEGENIMPLLSLDYLTEFQESILKEHY